MEQAGEQSLAARTKRPIEWHFAEKPVADYFRNEFAKAGYSNIEVYFTPPLEKDAR
jgi:hypothetical protein